jgi:tetratricopeptide (TPR) repeat protein
VQTALFGRVTQLNGVLTLSLELVDTKTGDRIWGEIYTRKQTDLISLQREIARDVAKKLGTRLSDAEERRAVKNGTEDPEAHNLYLQGLYELNKRTTVDIRKSITLFEQATQKDPNYAIAYASLASAYLTLVPYSAGLSREEANGLASKAHEVAARAEEIDDSLPEVHAILGSIDDDDWKFADAENEYKRAIALNPNDASTRLSYSLNLSYRARYPEALAEINKAYELDPFSRSVAFNVGARLNEARRFDEAIAQLKRVLEIEPDHSLTHFVLSEVLEAEGRYAEAISELRVADVLLEKTSPEVADRKAAALTNALRSGGIEAYWKKRLKFCLEEYDKGNGLAYRNAIAYARLGEKDRAFEQLEKSFANHELYLPWLRSEPAFDSMIDDPRFTDIVKRMGLD